MSEQEHVVLLLGSGGREHALYERLIRHALVICAPGNGGMQVHDRRDIGIKNFDAILKLIRKEKVTMVVVGPEEPLVCGITDFLHLHAPEVLVFGPEKRAAKLEGNKAYCMEICWKYSIRTPKYATLIEGERIDSVADEFGLPLVLKANGLCGGKGVSIERSLESARARAKAILVDKIFGDEGGLIVVQKFIPGKEVSVMAFCDGKRAILMRPVRDHKHAFDGNEGPMTGGMGAYTPVPDVDDTMVARIKAEIIDPLVAACAAEGHPYHGILFAGIMIHDGDPYLLEVNCRGGDPETEVVLPLLENNLLDVMLACITPGGLDNIELHWKGLASVSVALVRDGYPELTPGSTRVFGLDETTWRPNVEVFHAGTRINDEGQYFTDGGRVAHAVGIGQTLLEATHAAYDGAFEITFQGKRVRLDIAADAI